MPKRYMPKRYMPKRYMPELYIWLNDICLDYCIRAEDDV